MGRTVVKVLVIGLALPGLAGCGEQRGARGTQEPSKEPARRVAILVARETLNRGDVLKEHAVAPVEVEVAAVSDLHILYAERKAWLGQPLAARVRAGSPLMKTHFLAPEEPSPARHSIEPGWRALTLGADQVGGISGLMIPGSRVDVLCTMRAPGGSPETPAEFLTKRIASNLEVLALDAATEVRSPARGDAREEPPPRSVTLHVTPLEAGLLVYARDVGKVTLVLRRLDDASDLTSERPAATTGSTFDAMMNEAERKRLSTERGRRGPAPE